VTGRAPATGAGPLELLGKDGPETGLGRTVGLGPRILHRYHRLDTGLRRITPPSSLGDRRVPARRDGQAGDEERWARRMSRLNRIGEELKRRSQRLLKYGGKVATVARCFMR